MLALASTALPPGPPANLLSTAPSSGSAGSSREAGRIGTRTLGALVPMVVMATVMAPDSDVGAEDMDLAVDLVGDMPAALRMPTPLTVPITRRSLPSTSQTMRSLLL